MINPASAESEKRELFGCFGLDLTAFLRNSEISIRTLTLGDTSPAWRLRPGISFGNAGENHRRTVGKLRDQ